MWNTPAAWETMSEADAAVRVARLRRCAEPLRDVYAAFTPWQRLSTGLAEFDHLLSRAGVSSGGTAPQAESGDGAGGFAVGGVHELYGPPLSGKSFLLRRLGAAFVRRMTAYRQWTLEEMHRDETWLYTSETPSSDDCATADNECLSPQSQRRKGASSGFQQGQPSLPSSHSTEASAAAPPLIPTPALQDWELFVCLVCGPSSQLSARAGAGSLQCPEVSAWQEALTSVFPATAAADRTHPQLPCADTAPWQEQQRAYAETHTHLCKVSSPNELLTFLEQLLDPSSPKADSHTSLPTSLSSSPPAPEACRSQGSSSTTTRQRRKRQRDSSSGAQVHAFSSPFQSSQQRLWRRQRQRLLLVDGLDKLWLHPTLGTHAGTHSGLWFAMELHRQMRKFVTPHLTWPPLASGTDVRSRGDSCAAHSTVVLTNGCYSGSHSIQTPQQLQRRLLASRSAPFEPPFASPCVPQPSGNAVWVFAVDTRCLVEPAHPSLTSLPSSGSSPPLGGARPPANAAATAASTTIWERTSDGRSARPVTVRASSSSPHQSLMPAVREEWESLVTVVQGGACVMAGWVLHSGDGETGRDSLDGSV